MSVVLLLAVSSRNAPFMVSVSAPIEELDAIADLLASALAFAKANNA
jgi:hypothetical protein